MTIPVSPDRSVGREGRPSTDAVEKNAFGSRVGVNVNHCSFDQKLRPGRVARDIRHLIARKIVTEIINIIDCGASVIIFTIAECFL